MKKRDEFSHSPKKKYAQGLPVYNFHAAGIDIGDTKHDVAIMDGNGGFETREYPFFTQDLHELVEWLVSAGLAHVCPPSKKARDYGVRLCQANAEVS